MPRLSIPSLAVGTVALLALGVAAGTALPLDDPPTGSTDPKDPTGPTTQAEPAVPRSVILVIGDGMDDSIITAARSYSLGAAGRLALDELPFTGAMTTYGLGFGPGPDHPIDYVSDSAATASAWSTGQKTVGNRLSQGPSSAADVPGDDHETVLEKFRDAGRLTGNVSTAEITDATPAAAASHINARDCQGPSDMAACPTARKSVAGKGSIAEQLVDNQVDVLLGGGMDRYTQPLEDESERVLDYATKKWGYRPVTTAAELDAITDLSGGPVLGLFAPSNMTPKYAPLVATPPPGSGSPTTRCQPADTGTQPDLATMTKTAIDLLDNPDGFFLQAESAMIDKQEHDMDICGAIGDVERLDDTVEVALDYQRRHPDTLVIVTGDHAQATQIVRNVRHGRQTATLLTADGDPLTVAYSTDLGDGDHTGTQIRVAAIGPGASDVTGTIDQTDLFEIMLGGVPGT